MLCILIYVNVTIYVPQISNILIPISFNILFKKNHCETFDFQQ